jgi:hypothetical protein
LPKNLFVVHAILTDVTTQLAQRREAQLNQQEQKKKKKNGKEKNYTFVMP